MSEAKSEARSEVISKHRKYVGSGARYDLAAANQFGLLTALGLREEHRLLDIGCGSLRGGRLFIPYLAVGNYYGMEPNRWLIDDGIAQELGQDAIEIKQPTFSSDENFSLTTFGVEFDYMLAQSIFSHASQAHIRRCLSEARKCLKPDGIFAATFLEGDLPYEGEEWVYPGSSHYPLDFMMGLVQTCGLASRPLPWTHHNRQTWLLITHPGHLDQVSDPADPLKLRVLAAEAADARESLAELAADPLVGGAIALQRRLKKLGFLKTKRRK